MTGHELDTAALHTAVDIIRGHRRLSWRDVAKETGLSPSTFTRLGQGHRPDADALIALLVWLGDDGGIRRYIRKRSS